MANASLPRSIRKYIRREKARIRKTAATAMDCRARLDALSVRFAVSSAMVRSP
ncbi:MAG: hypothetical protein Q7S96_01915 [bacterium]|nr:hypothetical protein [bacterium]